MKLEFLKDTRGIYNVLFRAGQIIEYYPWHYDWQGMSEPERVEKGIFVYCCGHGEFDRFIEGVDVRVKNETDLPG